jgi:ankyrin repeat protein
MLEEGTQGTALHGAVTFGATELVEMLVANGTDVNKQDEHIKATALQWAYRRDEEQMVRIMSKYPAVNVNAPAGTLGTALYAAAPAGNLRTLGALLHVRAQVNISGGCLGSPLQAALYVRNLTTAIVLPREP